jgi:citrate lyase beta subunit
MLAGASSIEADEVIFDLQDAVAPRAKEQARGLVSQALAQPGWKGRATAVRVNAAGTPCCHRDLIALAELAKPPLSVVLPKVESRATSSSPIARSPGSRCLDGCRSRFRR